MSRWHREHPELVGTWADPWMIHESYRKATPPPPEPYEDRHTGWCGECGGMVFGGDSHCGPCRSYLRQSEEGE